MSTIINLGTTSRMDLMSKDPASGIGEKRRLVKRPFDVDRQKRQNVRFGFPKVQRQTVEEQHEKATKSVGGNNLKSCYVAESRLKTRQTTKKVVFAEGTKTYNGLRPDRLYFDEIVYRFFVLGKEFSSVDVLRLVGIDASLVCGVNDLLVDLCKRISEAENEADEESDGGVPVLLCGGGHGIRVTSFHLPYLVSLQRVAAEAVRVVSLGFSIDSDEESKTCQDSSRAE